MRRAEAVVVERYPQWVRLAYLTLPAGLGRHTRVLRAHRAVQQALRPAGRRAGQGEDPVAAVRTEVVRRAAGRMRPLPPWVGVWGLRMWPGAEELEEAARDLAGLSAFARAAHVLCHWDGLPGDAAVQVLAAAGAPGPAEAVRAGLAVAPRAAAGRGSAAGVHPAQVQTRPADLLLRSHRARAGWAAAGALALCAALVTASGEDGTRRPVPYAGAPAGRGALDPGRLVQVPGRTWSDTGRVDFTAWPARGGRTADRPLLARALATWGAPPAGADVTAAPGTTDEPPSRSPQLLYAGEPAAGAAVVVLLDGDRLVRYTERGASRSLDFVRVDDANVTTAAAVVLLRGADGAGPVRKLLGPWITSAGLRDLTAPGTPVRRLPVGADGTVTVPAGVRRGCAPGPVLEVASSARIVEKHAFLLADLGGVLPVHLTYTPLPEEAGVAHARQPREATGRAALERWAREACVLREVDGRAVRAVNLWDFARAGLPEGAGPAVWSCIRATHWTGRGDVLVRLRPPSGEPLTAARVPATAACGRFGQHVLAGTVWRAPSGRAYQLAAGSREVAGITASGSVRAGAAGRTFAAPAAPPGAEPPVLSARLHSGTVLTALDGGNGGRD